MAQPLKNSRIGVYECGMAGGLVTKGRYLWGDYVGVFSWDALISRIVPDLKGNSRLRDAQFPVLITSWQLRGHDASKGVLGISRRISPQPRRKKIQGTERWEAVIDSSWRVTKVEGRRLAALRDEGADASSFTPIDIKGEPLSTTVLRERR